jgi:hypothetical protein
MNAVTEATINLITLQSETIKRCQNALNAVEERDKTLKELLEVIIEVLALNDAGSVSIAINSIQNIIQQLNNNKS